MPLFRVVPSYVHWLSSFLTRTLLAGCQVLHIKHFTYSIQRILFLKCYLLHFLVTLPLLVVHSCDPFVVMSYEILMLQILDNSQFSTLLFVTIFIVYCGDIVLRIFYQTVIIICYPNKYSSFFEKGNPRQIFDFHR